MGDTADLIRQRGIRSLSDFWAVRGIHQQGPDLDVSLGDTVGMAKIDVELFYGGAM